MFFFIISIFMKIQLLIIIFIIIGCNNQLYICIYFSESPKKKKSQKQARTWEGQIARGEMESLDYSSKATMTTEEEAAQAAQLADPAKYGTINKDGVYEVLDVDQENDNDNEDGDDEEEYDILQRHQEDNNTQNSNSSGMFSFFKNITGQRELTPDALDPVLSDMKEHLIKKNVASDIAEHLCQSVRTSLIGKKIGSWSSKFWFFIYLFY